MAFETFDATLTRNERKGYLKKIIRKDELIDMARTENYNNRIHALISGLVAISTGAMAYLLYKDNETGLAIISGLNTLASLGTSGYLMNKTFLINEDIKDLQEGKRRLEELL